MIINPSAELENFIVSGSADSTPELLRLLKEQQIPFTTRQSKLLLDSSLEILQEEQILCEMLDVIDGSIPLKFEIYRDHNNHYSLLLHRQYYLVYRTKIQILLWIFV